MLLAALRVDPDIRVRMYGHIVEAELKKVKEEIEALESMIKDRKSNNPFGFSEEEQKTHTVLAAKRIQYGALYRMIMMSKDQKSFESRVDGYIEGKADPEEKRMAAEASKRRAGNTARLKERTERPYFWNIFSSDDGAPVMSEPHKRPAKSRSMELQEKSFVPDERVDLLSGQKLTGFTSSVTSEPNNPTVATGNLLDLDTPLPPSSERGLDNAGSFTTPPFGPRGDSNKN